MKEKIKNLINVFVFFMSRNRILSHIYYSLFSKKFFREHYSVLSGKVKYLKEIKENKSNTYILIRNIHRLEKGLLMKPRRDVFGLAFIEDTMSAFKNVWTLEKMQSDDQFKWFYDVLFEYFEVVVSHSKVNKLKIEFEEFVGSKEDIANNELKRIPYFRNEENKSNISFDEFYKLTKYRRSVRWFKDQTVPRELVDKAVKAAIQSPSACNRQPFMYRIIDDKELVSKVAKIPMGVKGYVEGIPMIIVVVGNLDAYFDERDRHVIYVDASLANMTFMLALETLGLSSCSINWPDIEHLEQKMEHILGLDSHQRPIMCMAVGYPDSEGKVAYSEKRNLEEIRKYN